MKGQRGREVVKEDDDLVATYLVSSWSPRLIGPARRLGLGPDAVTGISAGFGLLAALWFADGTRGGLIVGAVLLYLSYVLDRLDGQLARHMGRSSAIGGWAGAVAGHGTEMLVYAGLAAGYGGTGEIWPLAVGALTLLVVRQSIDHSYADSRPAVPRQRPAPGAPRREKGRGTGAPRAKVMRRWAKKVIVLPAGERTMLICVTAALFNARVTFLALLGWGCVAVCAMLAARVRRSLNSGSRSGGPPR